MKTTLLLFLLLVSFAHAQTPLEFGIVQDLVGGSPRISVFSIKTRTEGSQTLLHIAAKSGIQFDCNRHVMIVDSMTSSEVLIEGQISYTASIMKPTLEHFFTVIRQNMNVHGSGGITHLKVELITYDEMGWISVTIPLSRVDSLLAGQLTHLDFWAQTPIQEVEIGTGGVPVSNESPLPELHGAPQLEIIQEVIQQQNNQAWKSLILPGWGQLSSGEGLPFVNILVEIGGAALLFTDDYQEVGIGILGVNHIISFSDLL